MRRFLLKSVTLLPLALILHLSPAARSAVVLYEFHGQVKNAGAENSTISPNTDGSDAFKQNDYVIFTGSYDAGASAPFTIDSFTINNGPNVGDPTVYTGTEGAGTLTIVDGATGSGDSVTFTTDLTATGQFLGPSVWNKKGSTLTESGTPRSISLSFVRNDGSVLSSTNAPPETVWDRAKWDTAGFSIQWAAPLENVTNWTVSGDFTTTTSLSATATPEPALMTSLIALACLGWYGFRHKQKESKIAVSTHTA
jgi:hypothetical protein